MMKTETQRRLNFFQNMEGVKANLDASYLRLKEGFFFDETPAKGDRFRISAWILVVEFNFNNEIYARFTNI